MNMSIINLRIYSLYQPLFNIVMTIYYEYIPYSPQLVVLLDDSDI